MAGEGAHFYEPARGHGLRHDPFNAIIAPRPIGWVSTVDAQGRRNLAPYSFFNGFNYVPPIIGFSSIGRKDSLANAEATGAFVWNLATRGLAERMNATSATVPHEVDEFELAGLTPVPSRTVRPPRVLESPVNFECKVSQILQLQAADGSKIDSWVVFGEVVAVHIEKDLLVDGVYQSAAAHPITRLGRMGDYAELRADAMFEMKRPR
ncbi:MAG TPA: flavin reductase family protein [Rhizomicrobium sp.]|nr:flavin reductase family protein [Rhizomicrobium sp.]